MSTPDRRSSSTATMTTPAPPIPENPMAEEKSQLSKKRPAFTDVTNQSKKLGRFASEIYFWKWIQMVMMLVFISIARNPISVHTLLMTFKRTCHHLRVIKPKRMPCADFMETIQKDINALMRAVLIDWLVQILQMESAVLNYLKFELTVPTAKVFLRQFVHAAQMINQDCMLGHYALYTDLVCYGTPSSLSDSYWRGVYPKNFNLEI
ncbi:Cyclin-like protein [Corchorus olitorius]|uniref:Cyclin-like protein n=1 Tax=Corchorus olitorius TaxID=93759 RepID=A0A1R3L493_9ROSI|nr:Cyclin-like protein [Corchorus olitorius]